MNQRIFPVERHPVQVHQTLRIDVDLDVVEPQHIIGRPRLWIEFELIAQSRTSAAQHAQPQPPVYAFAHESLADFLNGFRRNCNHSSTDLDAIAFESDAYAAPAFFL